MSKKPLNERCECLNLSYNSHLGKRRDIKRWRRQRVNNGFSFIDAISMSDYLAWVTTGMLDYLADHCVGYPGIPSDDPVTRTYEGWTAFLRGTSKKIKRAQRLVNDDMDLGLSTEQVKQWEKEYLARKEEGERLVQEAFTDIGKYFFKLWD